MIALIDGREKSISEIMESLHRPSHLDFDKENELVKEIVNNIKKYGQSALIDYIKRFDNFAIDDIGELLVCDDEIDKAYSDVSDEFIAIIKKPRAKYGTII